MKKICGPKPRTSGAEEPFNPEELKAAASRLSPSKRPGLDGISNEVVHLIAKKSHQILMSAFNKCLAEEIFSER